MYAYISCSILEIAWGHGISVNFNFLQIHISSSLHSISIHLHCWPQIFTIYIFCFQVSYIYISFTGRLLSHWTFWVHLHSSFSLIAFFHFDAVFALFVAKNRALRMSPLCNKVKLLYKCLTQHQCSRPSQKRFIKSTKSFYLSDINIQSLRLYISVPNIRSSSKHCQ